MTTRQNVDSEYVRRVRHLLGLSQTDFATRLGVTKRTIIRYEMGKTIPAPTILAIRSLEHEARKRK